MSRSIIKKTVGIGSSTLLSRFFAYIREVLMIQFFGIGAVSDAFFIALRIPNSLRKVFAEGALSSVLVPALIHAERKDGENGINRLLTLSFFMIELLVVLLVVGISWQADWIVHFSAPSASEDLLKTSAQYVKILAPFILFLSSSSILAAALQATHRLLLPGIAPAVLNCMYVGFLLLSLYFSWSVETFCWTMIYASIINMFIHLWVCAAYNFKFKLPEKEDWLALQHVLLQLLPCILSVGIGEINFLIDSRFASSLHSGTLSLLRYAYQFLNIPLGVIATSLSMVLLPHFSRIDHSKKELGIYLAEAVKFITWIMLPIMMVMFYSSREIFESMFFSNKFTIAHVFQAQSNLNAYLVGLTFFALEKILLNAFYALRSTGIATVVAIVTTALNYYMNQVLIGMYGGMGLALATSLSAGIRVIIFIMILAYYFKINFNFADLSKLLRNYILQLMFVGAVFMTFATIVSRIISSLTFSLIIGFGPMSLDLNPYFFLHSFGFWIWFGPLAGAFFFVLHASRKLFGVSFSYLD